MVEAGLIAHNATRILDNKVDRLEDTSGNMAYKVEHIRFSTELQAANAAAALAATNKTQGEVAVIGMTLAEIQEGVREATEISKAVGRRLGEVEVNLMAMIQEKFTAIVQAFHAGPNPVLSPESTPSSSTGSTPFHEPHPLHTPLPSPPPNPQLLRTPEPPHGTDPTRQNKEPRHPTNHHPHSLDPPRHCPRQPLPRRRFWRTWPPETSTTSPRTFP